MALGGIDLGQELLNVPMGTMIQSMALSIAKAQWELDKSSMTVAEMMSGRRVLRDLETGKLVGGNGSPTTTPTILDSRVYFGYSIDLDANKNPVRTPQLLSMLELGFTPTFYQFVDTIIEVKISISIKSETTSNSSSSSKDDKTTVGTSNKSSNDWSYRGYNYWGGGFGYSGSNSREDTKEVSTSQVNATYSQKFGYTAEGASLLRTKLVPIPPPAILEERIREIMRIENAYEQWNMLNLMRTKLEGERKAAQDAKNTALAEEKDNQMKALDQRINRALDTIVGLDPARG
jgi:hypothetical protein